MKINMHSILLFGLIVLMISSCNTSSNLADSSIIQKRRYTNGYHLALKGSPKELKNDKTTLNSVETLEAQDVALSKQAELEEVFVSTEIVESEFIQEPITEPNLEPEFVDEVVHNDETQSDALPVYREINDAPKSKKEIKKNLRLLKSLKASPAPAASSESLILYIILAIILPPLAVGLLYGISTEFWISLILTFLAYIPGIIYALIKVFQKG